VSFTSNPFFLNRLFELGPATHTTRKALFSAFQRRFLRSIWICLAKVKAGSLHVACTAPNGVCWAPFSSWAGLLQVDVAQRVSTFTSVFPISSRGFVVDPRLRHSHLASVLSQMAPQNTPLAPLSPTHSKIEP
jgi:hypothetical protein